MLRAFSIENFMSIEKATVEFDTRNLINIKGYNDSGKSAILRAMEVLFYNMRPNAQVNFIQDGKDYFRLMAKFDDGVIILRDKYINGQSLYEMYKGDQLLYTTKKDGVLTKVMDIPEPIENYLGLLSCDGVFLNSRSCFEKQFLVQTTGSENYKMLNAVLKSEELATAGTLLNNDKNKLGTDIAQLDNQISAYSEILRGTDGLTEGIVSGMESLDSGVGKLGDELKSLETIGSLVREVTSIGVLSQELPIIDTSESSLLSGILAGYAELSSIRVLSEELVSADTSEVVLLQRISSMMGQLFDTDALAKPVGYIDTSELDLLERIKKVLSDIKAVNVEGIETAISELGEQMRVVSEEAVSLGKRFVQCRNCGTLNEVAL